jgi:hypothetical protein
MSKLTVAYDLGDHVILKDVQWPGRVQEIRFEGKNVWYKISYWHEMKNCCIDVAEDELCYPS